MNDHLTYAKYVATHKWFVLTEGRKLGLGWWQLLKHDWSKLTWHEWSQYVQFHTRRVRDPKSTADYLAAWSHHVHHNPHHHEHWLLARDQQALEMPTQYVREMLADWRSVGRTLKQDDPGATKWYLQNACNIKLHPRTRALLHELMGLPTPDHWPTIINRDSQ